LEVKLAPSEITRIGEAVPPGAAAGARYPAEGMRGIEA
jgi:hypothetical protein